MYYTTHRQPVESVNHYIGQTKMVKRTPVIVFKEFNSSPMMKIKLFLGEHLSKTFMICQHPTSNVFKSLGKYYSCKLKVMNVVVLLMYLKGDRSISYDVTSLHQHTT